MMIQKMRTRVAGFTLIELAIVLAVAGLLFVGLWRLLAGGNQQLRDSSAASQQQQLITAIKGYLASQEGQNYLAALAPNANPALLLPNTNTSNANCKASANMVGPPNISGLCDFLPGGFDLSSTNSYGQTYGIRVLKDASLATVTPRTYSFMIGTFGATQIPDTSGGRISSLIGGDGGFIYGTNVCGAANLQTACGAYGAWSADITTYGFGAYAQPGYIVSRTFVSPEQDSSLQWLARPLLPSDQTQPDTPFYNTMQTNFLLGNQNFYFSNNRTAVAGGGTMFLQGGDIQGIESAKISLNFATSGGILQAPNNPFVRINTRCTVDSPSPNGTLTSDPANCRAGFQVNGDGQFAGRLNVNSLYAASFIYSNGAPVISDMRFKTDIHRIDKPLNDIMKLNPVSFKYKTDGSRGLGVIAQELEKIYPELIKENGDIKYVSYEGLIGPLIGAVQELKKQNDELRTMIQDESRRGDRLERQLKEKSAP